MDEESRSWAFTAPLTFLLFCGAAALFFLGYIPEEKEARKCEALVQAAQKRIADLTVQELAAKRRIAELQAGIPEAIEEAAREVSNYGTEADYLPSGWFPADQTRGG